MSFPLRFSSQRRQILPNGADDGRLVRLALMAPLGLLLAAAVALAVCCADLLDLAAQGRPAELGLGPLYLAAGLFVAASVAVVAVQSLRVASRVAGPEYRLRLALQRIRSGDLGFRVNLRRGDLLTGLARECNELLDWLNANPPSVARRVGGDTFELGAAEPRQVEAVDVVDASSPTAARRRSQDQEVVR
jgi:HAMP domain-containing protein